MADFPLVGQYAFRKHLVLPVRCKGAVLDHRGEEIEQIFRIHFTGMDRQHAGYIEWARDNDAMMFDVFARFG